MIGISKVVTMYIQKKVTNQFVNQEGENVKKIGSIVGDLVFYALTMFSFFIGFKVMGMDIGMILGGITLAIGLAFRETLSNMIAGLVIFSSKEFQLGNIIELKVPGKMILGRVEEINMRSLTLRTLDLRRVVIPNKKVTRSLVTTYNTEELIKMEIKIIADPSIPAVLLVEKTLETVNSLEFVLYKEYTQVFIDSFDSKGYVLMISFTFDPNVGRTMSQMKSQVNMKLVQTYEEIKPSKKEKLENKTTSIAG